MCVYKTSVKGKTNRFRALCGEWTFSENQGDFGSSTQFVVH